jgi:hypothetical protein
MRVLLDKSVFTQQDKFPDFFLKTKIRYHTNKSLLHALILSQIIPFLTPTDALWVCSFFVTYVTHKDIRSSLKMAHGCRNM